VVAFDRVLEASAHVLNQSKFLNKRIPDLREVLMNVALGLEKIVVLPNKIIEKLDLVAKPIKAAEKDVKSSFESRTVGREIFQ